MKTDFRPIKFPTDELKHNTLGDWWYFNGNLTGEDGHEYSYMNCLFRARLPLITGERAKKIPSHDVFFYHSILTDIKNNQFYPHIDNISVVSKDSFSGPLLNVYFTKPFNTLNYSSYYIEEPKPFDYRLKGELFDFTLENQKPPLLEGGDGYVTNLGKATYYYSLTNLKTQGVIKINNKRIKVTGKSWMDHQWSNVVPDKDFWNWFSIQLDNNEEIVCYEYGSLGKTSFLATAIGPDGKQKTFKDIKITAIGDEWKSSITKATYPLSWRVEIADGDIELEIASRVKDHEMNFLHINYWESPMSVSGTIRGKAVSGKGYMELAGRPSIFNDLGFFRSKLREKISQLGKN